MRGYTVYRVDYVTGRRDPIGSILDRREKDRGPGENLMDLLVEARRLFGKGEKEAIRIVLDAPRDAREVRRLAYSKGIVTITSC